MDFPAFRNGLAAYDGALMFVSHDGAVWQPSAFRAACR
jgi:ATPase subunit of ABC transporter with duplicated ATPase domains